MARFSLEEEDEAEGPPTGRKQSRRKGGGEDVCGCGSSKKRLKEVDAAEEREEDEGNDIDDDDQGEEEEEEEGGEDGVMDKLVGEENGQSFDDGSVCVRMDPEVLDCSVCYEPLRPPIFQCQNGHAACSSCSNKLSNKCHVCSHAIFYSRCLTLEKVIESIKFSCMYACYGCNKSMSYIDKTSHEETCIYAPCFCPVDGCIFAGPREKLSSHFINHHTPYERFSYNQIFKVELDKMDPFRALYAEDGHLFLLLNDSASSLGRLLSLVCFRPRSWKWDFLYELSVNAPSTSSCCSCINFKSSATNITAWKGFYPVDLFLMVPPDLHTPAAKIIVDVCIRKAKRVVTIK